MNAMPNVTFLEGNLTEVARLWFKSPISSQVDKYVVQRKCVAIFVLHINY
jgi:hypothetical protein